MTSSQIFYQQPTPRLDSVDNLFQLLPDRGSVVQSTRVMGDKAGNKPDGLEREQSGRIGQYRQAEEGNEARLTELAAPPPESPGQRRKHGLESKEHIARREQTRQGPSQNRDDVLTELAAPKPIPDGEDSDSTRQDHSDEERVPPRPSSSASSHQPKSTRYITELYVVSHLIFFSFLGTLARLGTEALTTYPGTPFPSTVLWANLGGSFFMGFLLEDRKMFRSREVILRHKHRSHNTNNEDNDSNSEKEEEMRKNRDQEHAKFKKGLPLYIGLSTGFCGSFTSFSSYIQDSFLALTNDLPDPSGPSPYHDSTQSILSRNGGYSFMATLAILLIQPSVSFAGFITGAHLALALQPYFRTIPSHYFRKSLDPFMVVSAFGCWIGAILFAIFPPAPTWRYRAVMPLVFSPPGVLARFYCSKYLNGRIPSFPLGTFVINIFGTCIEGMAYDLQHTVTTLDNNSNQGTGSAVVAACTVLTGVMQGFCGCATTVSTWMAELNSLETKHRWIYGLVTVAVALGFQVVIMGSVGWTVGFKTPACSSTNG